YLKANAYNFGMIVALLIGALGLGIVFACTKSLIPSMVAHALINFPAAGVWQWIVAGIIVIGAGLVWCCSFRLSTQVFQNTAIAPALLFAMLGAVYAMAASRFEIMPIVAVAALVVALILEALERRARPAVTPTSVSSG